MLQSSEMLEFQGLATSDFRLKLNTKFLSVLEICPKFLGVVQCQYSGLETILFRII